MSEKLYTEQVGELMDLVNFHKLRRDKHDRRKKYHGRLCSTATELLDTLRERACQSCGGLGRVRNSYAQDDVRVETCRGCDGTGERT